MTFNFAMKPLKIQAYLMIGTFEKKKIFLEKSTWKPGPDNMDYTDLAVCCPKKATVLSLI